MKYESNTPMYSKDIARKPFFVRTGRTDVRTRVMLYAPPPHYKWRGHNNAIIIMIVIILMGRVERKPDVVAFED